ncbi:hypothetical protein FNV43_RR11363 [Rhamnella rubrinervis]|uniref:Cathepsin propeptide inhibitor domain-containing protein n=1 Tax=Rhamnella rubrinervis TaxID=2594499 RepID=A0A8K0H5V3_9ROSA|nr:hypothetical protein FNV43_RR11363 [Rhamnella rubrinervis]
MATLFRSLYTRSSKLAFGSSRTTPLPGFTNSAGFVVRAPGVTFVVPNHSRAHYPDVNIVGKAMLPNVLASSSKKDLNNLMRDALLGELNFPSSQLFEIWCKLYDKSYTSPEEERHRLRVFEKNKNEVVGLNKRINDMLNKATGTNTLTLCYDFREKGDRTQAEIGRLTSLGMPMLSSWKSSPRVVLKNLMKGALTGRVTLPSFLLFEVWRKLYDKSYTSHGEILYRLPVFADNIKIIMDLSKRKKITMDLTKRKKKTCNKGTITYNDLLHLADRTQTEVEKVYCGGKSI